MRVFLGLIEIAGYYSRLKRGLEELGYECLLLDISNDPQEYGGSEPTGRWFRWLRGSGARFLHAPSDRPWSRRFWFLIHSALRVPTFLWLLARFDVFIYGFRTSFFFHLELPVLRLFGKRIVCVFNGSDTRPPFINGSQMTDRSGGRTREYIGQARRICRDIRWVDRYAHAVVNHPAFAHYHGRPFVSWLHIGMPFDAPSFEPATARGTAAAVRILHAPSSPHAKGTGQIRAAIENLRSQGYSLDYVEVTGQTHSVVLAELARCDFVVDQLYSDTPMAGFATEAAAFGKPAVVGGYYFERMREDVPASAIPPSLYCHPDQLQESIERLIVDEAYRLDLGKRARQYVREHWTSRKVAERFRLLIENRIPQEWLYDPNDIRYLHGIGLSDGEARESVRRFIAAGGPAALQLEDKPELERLFCEFAEGAGSEPTPASPTPAARC